MQQRSELDHSVFFLPAVFLCSESDLSSWYKPSASYRQLSKSFFKFEAAEPPRLSVRKFLDVHAPLQCTTHPDRIRTSKTDSRDVISFFRAQSSLRALASFPPSFRLHPQVESFLPALSLQPHALASFPSSLHLHSQVYSAPLSFLVTPERDK